jgi:arogenate dehydrogenase (NADP+)
MKEMKCIQHDKYAARSQFMSHFLARVIYQYDFKETSIDTNNVKMIREYAVNLTEDHSFDLFSGLFLYNEHTNVQISKLRDALNAVEKQLLQCKIANST